MRSPRLNMDFALRRVVPPSPPRGLLTVCLGPRRAHRRPAAVPPAVRGHLSWRILDPGENSWLSRTKPDQSPAGNGRPRRPRADGNGTHASMSPALERLRMTIDLTYNHTGAIHEALTRPAAGMGAVPPPALCSPLKFNVPDEFSQYDGGPGPSIQARREHPIRPGRHHPRPKGEPCSTQIPVGDTSPGDHPPAHVKGPRGTRRLWSRRCSRPTVARGTCGRRARPLRAGPARRGGPAAGDRRAAIETPTDMLLTLAKAYKPGEHRP